ncbi:MAG: hypothetical protein Q7S66_04355 [bacterium]|nr:hypothetical protein [bacterium]
MTRKGGTERGGTDGRIAAGLVSIGLATAGVVAAVEQIPPTPKARGEQILPTDEKIPETRHEASKKDGKILFRPENMVLTTKTSIKKTANEPTDNITEDINKWKDQEEKNYLWFETNIKSELEGILGKKLYYFNNIDIGKIEQLQPGEVYFRCENKSNTCSVNKILKSFGQGYMPVTQVILNTGMGQKGADGKDTIFTYSGHAYSDNDYIDFSLAEGPLVDTTTDKMRRILRWDEEYYAAINKDLPYEEQANRLEDLKRRWGNNLDEMTVTKLERKINELRESATEDTK